MAGLTSSNPALRRYGAAEQPPAYQQPQQYAQPYGAPAPMGPDGFAYGYGAPPTPTGFGAPPTTAVTLDDVVVRTASLLGVLAVLAGVGWFAVEAAPSAAYPMAVGAVLVALGLSFFVNLSRTVRVPAIIAYAALEGFAVGAVSRVYSSLYNGIVLQALIGTFGIFALMLTLHRTGLLRATPKMARIVGGAVLGIMVMYGIDLLLSAFGGPQLPLVNSSGPLGILISLAIVVVASLTFTLDFAQIEAGVAAGVPEKESWRMGFGLLVSFVWVYLELLRLLAKLNDRR